jgi:hypothetical protein
MSMSSTGHNQSLSVCYIRNNPSQAHIDSVSDKPPHLPIYCPNPDLLIVLQMRLQTKPATTMTPRCSKVHNPAPPPAAGPAHSCCCMLVLTTLLLLLLLPLVPAPYNSTRGTSTLTASG